MKAKQPLLFLVASICVVLLFYIMSLPVNALGGEPQVKILSDDTSYCNAPVFPYPLELFPNYNKSEQLDVKYKVKELNETSKSVKQFRVRATLYFIDSSNRIFFNSPYYNFLFGGVENLDSTYGFCPYNDLVARREHCADFVIGKKYWLLLERRLSDAPHYIRVARDLSVSSTFVAESVFLASALHESSVYYYYIIDSGDCK